MLGKTNVSILGYCDDIILLSPSYKHMNELLQVCKKYAIKWKLEFNNKKSVSAKFGDIHDEIVEFFIGFVLFSLLFCIYSLLFWFFLMFLL